MKRFVCKDCHLCGSPDPCTLEARYGADATPFTCPFSGGKATWQEADE
jgi:hypothetical protein